MIKSLQSLRFLMALMIFHHHFFTNPQIAQFGALPVAFFFMLSGFVMTIGYADKVTSDSFSYKSYLTKRLIKLMPLNAVCLALWLILPIMKDITGGHISISTYLLTIPDLLLVQAWVPIKEVYWSGNAVAWFLSDMLFCYLLFPVLVKMLTKKCGKTILFILIAVYLVTVRHVEGDALHAFVYISPFIRVIDFMIGILLSLVLPTKTEVVKQPSVETVLEVLAIAITILTLVTFPLVMPQYRVASFYWIPSIILITVFTLSARAGGGIFQVFSARKSWCI